MRIVMLVIGILAWASVEGSAKEIKAKKAWKLVDRLYDADLQVRQKARDVLIEAKDLSLAAALVEAVFFNTNGLKETVQVLEAWFGESHGSNYKAWIDLLGRRTDLSAKPGYLAYKARLYGMIDPALADFFNESFPATIRPEEILSGGVKKDGIPALMQPPLIPASEASFMLAEERVFGVSFNGDHRAYPLRIMDWHEMINDVVGGQPISLSYCTLCGSGILFDTRREDGTHFTFGSSGLLYRSNKLMYDHQSNNLWSNFTGKPVMGPLVDQEVEVKILPVAVTSWGEWLATHPDTQVLSLKTGFRRNYRPGAAYGSYFESPKTMFPVWNAPQDSERLKSKDWVWVVVFKGQRRAYPLKELLQKPFWEDQLAGESLVLLVDQESEAIRVYHKGNQPLSWQDGKLKGADGKSLSLTEEAIIGGAQAMPRVPGHRAYWFSWYSFFPDQSLWQPNP